MKPLTTLDAETLRGLRGLLHFLRGALAHAFGIAVAVDVVGQDLLVARVDVVAHGLADEVGADGVALQPVLLEQGALGVAVFLVGLGDFKVIAPAAEFHAVVAERLGLLAERFPAAGRPTGR